MKIFICGNGNISFSDYQKYYATPLSKYINNKDVSFVVCDFRGTDILTMELLKYTPNVYIYHMGHKPRYIPDKFKTQVENWKFIGGFLDDSSRDLEAIKDCTHFLAVDFNSNEKRKSGTLKNIETCLKQGKIAIK